MRILKLAVLSSFALLLACSSMEEIDTSTAEGAYKLAQRYEKNERYQEAIAQYLQVKNKYPYSKLATEAELRVADIHYDTESFIEAQNAYQVFKELHPRHPKMDYVTYRLGMSYFQQLPSTIDRDLSLADNAILYFDEVITSYPNSEFAAKAKKHKRKALKMLAGKEKYIADFYFIREMFNSALGRYEDLLRRYSGLGLDDEALYGAAVSAYRIDEKEKAEQYYNKLISDFPKSESSEKAKREIGDEL